MKTVRIARIYLREDDKGPKGRLWRHVYNLLRDQHAIHGVTVFRGIAGFGGHGDVQAIDLLTLNPGFPVIIEFFDQPDLVDKALASIASLIPPGHLLVWDASSNT